MRNHDVTQKLGFSIVSLARGGDKLSSCLAYLGLVLGTYYLHLIAIKRQEKDKSNSKLYLENSPNYNFKTSRSSQTSHVSVKLVSIWR